MAFFCTQAHSALGSAYYLMATKDKNSRALRGAVVRSRLTRAAECARQPILVGDGVRSRYPCWGSFCRRRYAPVAHRKAPASR